MATRRSSPILMTKAHKLSAIQVAVFPSAPRSQETIDPMMPGRATLALPAKLARARPRACRCFFTHSLTPPLSGGLGVGNGTGALPPLVSASTSVEITMSIAVRMLTIVIPCSRKSVQMRSASVVSSWRSHLMVSRIRLIWDRRAALFRSICLPHGAYSGQSLTWRCPTRSTRGICVVDVASCFMGAVSQLLTKHRVKVRLGRVDIHRDQGLLEHWNWTLAERLFGHQYAQEMCLPSGKRSTEWVAWLPSIVAALNGEVTRLTGKKPSYAIKAKTMAQKPSSVVPDCPVGLKEQRLPSGVGVRYLYQPGELEGGRHCATDPVWSLGVYRLGRSVTKPGEPVLYYL